MTDKELAEKCLEAYQEEFKGLSHIYRHMQVLAMESVIKTVLEEIVRACAYENTLYDSETRLEDINTFIFINQFAKDNNIDLEGDDK